MKKKIDIICIITARSGSKGLKNKNIRKLKGLPLIAHTIIAAKKSKVLSRVILSTDSKLYAKIGSRIPFFTEVCWQLLDIPYMFCLAPNSDCLKLLP